MLNIHEHRAFYCILQQHQIKTGYVNGGLVVTRRDFVAAGIHPKHITGALRVLQALGIIECMRNLGGSRNGRQSQPVPPDVSADDANG